MAMNSIRDLHRAAIDDGIIGVLDIGTSKIACMILDVGNPKDTYGVDDVETLMGTDATRVLGAASTRSRGIRLAQIEESADTERAVRTVLNAAEKMADAKVKYALVCCSSPNAENVRHIKIISERCGLKLAGITHSVRASGVSCLTENEQELGSTCVDMGGGSTGITVFAKNGIRFTSSILSGGIDVTKDISEQLQISFSLAERLKIFHGDAAFHGVGKPEVIELATDVVKQNDDHFVVRSSDVTGIIRSRLKVMFEGVREELDNAGFADLPSRQIILTGGAAQLSGIETLATEILEAQVRIASPFKLRSLPQVATSPAFSASVGLSILANKPDHQAWHRKSTARSPVELKGSSLSGRILDSNDLDRAISNTPNAEVVEIDPKSFLATSVPVSEADPDFLQDTRDRLTDALEIFSTVLSNDNQYMGINPEIEILKRSLQRYSERPLRLHDIALQVVRRVGHKEEIGECPTASSDALVADFKMELLSVAMDLRQQDLKVREVTQARTNEKFLELGMDELSVLPDLAHVISQPADSQLAKELQEDASTSLDPTVDQVSRSNALYRFSSRTFRILSIAYNQARSLLKEGVSVWKDLRAAIAAYGTIADFLKFLMSFFF